MSKIITVAKWEFFEKVKTRSFVISLILTPLIIIGFTIIPTLLSDKETDTTKVIGVIDKEGVFFNSLRSELEQYKIGNDQPAYLLINLNKEDADFSTVDLYADSLVVKGKLEGVLLINKSGLSYNLELRSMTSGNLKDGRRFENAFNNARINNELSGFGIDEKIRQRVLVDTELVQIRVDEEGRTSQRGFVEVFFSSLIFIMILAFVILSSGGMMIRSLVEEKSNRLIEILVSSCKAEELLTGKILGLSLLALFQILIWTMIGITLRGTNLIPASAFDNIFPMFIYFILGFMLYTALFVGIGSIVSTEQEAQQVTGYLSLMLFLPMVFAISAIENPDSGLVTILTYIPFTTPTVMLLKVNVKAISPEEFIGTITLLIVTVLLIIYITAKMFRIGILSYGKMPNVKQIIEWVKEK